LIKKEKICRRSDVTSASHFTRVSISITALSGPVLYVDG